jgi:uncharacterized Ntn-hydrolase superfamily protein
MATKKAATTKKSAAKKSSATLNPRLIFKIDWVKDPMPELRRILDVSAIRQLEAAKKDFGNRVNEILKSGQR